ncbi:MAG: hypothetical protein Q4G13_00495 [Moraxella sp.]|nr:hypothetical protein [Moraxella sp.]
MKKNTLFISILSSSLLLMACQSTNNSPSQPVISRQSPQKPAKNTQTPRTTGNLIIYYAAGKKSALMAAVASRGDKLLYEYNVINGIAIAPQQGDTPDVIGFYQSLDGVLQVNRDEVIELDLP